MGGTDVVRPVLLLTQHPPGAVRAPSDVAYMQPEEVLRDADSAMYWAKRSGAGRRDHLAALGCPTGKATCLRVC